MNGAMRILIIEDMDIMAFMLSEYIQLYVGSLIVSFEIVSTLEVAIKRLKLPGIDVNLLDLNLPNSQGIPTLVSLYANCPKHIPIIILTGDDCQELEEKCLKKGAQDFIRKTELVSTLKVNEFIRKLWHAVLRLCEREVIKEIYAPLQKEIEIEQKSIEIVKSIIDKSETDEKK